MLLRIDNYVRHSVAESVASRGRDVRFVRCFFRKGMPDSVMVAIGDRLSAMVVAWDREFEDLVMRISQCKPSEVRLPRPPDILSSLPPPPNMSPQPDLFWHSYAAAHLPSQARRWMAPSRGKSPSTQVSPLLQIVPSVPRALRRSPLRHSLMRHERLRCHHAIQVQRQPGSLRSCPLHPSSRHAI